MSYYNKSSVEDLTRTVNDMETIASIFSQVIYDCCRFDFNVFSAFCYVNFKFEVIIDNFSSSSIYSCGN